MDSESNKSESEDSPQDQKEIKELEHLLEEDEWVGLKEPSIFKRIWNFFGNFFAGKAIALNEPDEKVEAEELLTDEQAEWVSVAEVKEKFVYDEYFFPKGFLGEDDIDGFKQQMYAKHLKAMEEPILFLENFPVVFRFFWLRTNHEPIAFRFYKSVNGEYNFVVKMTSGQGGYGPGKIVIDKNFKMSQAQGDSLLNKAEECKFWNIPRINEVIGMDGASWVLEGMMDGRYHIVDRWSGGNSRINEICRMFMGFSGLKIENIY